MSEFLGRKVVQGSVERRRVDLVEQAFKGF